MENCKTGVAYKTLTYKTRANSNLNADQSNFLANETVMLVLELYVKYYSDKFSPETKLENCSLLLEEHVTT